MPVNRLVHELGWLLENLWSLDEIDKGNAHATTSSFGDVNIKKNRRQVETNVRFPEEVRAACGIVPRLLAENIGETSCPERVSDLAGAARGLPCYALTGARCSI